MEQHLDFEQPIYTCLEKIEELKKIIPEPENLHEEIAILEKQSKKETERIYSFFVSMAKSTCRTPPKQTAYH